MLLMHIAKRDPHNPIVPRIQQHVEGMMRMRSEILDESSRKRGLEVMPEGADLKRQRTLAPAPQQLEVTPLAPGQHSLADVYTLTGSEGLKAFDISTVPAELVARINVSTLSRIDPQLLYKAVDGIKGRLAALAAMPVPEINPETAPLGVDDDDDEYEPDDYPAEDTEQILNKLDSEPLVKVDNTDVGLKAFKLPPPPPLTPELALRGGQVSVLSILEFIKSLEEANKRVRSGVNRLAASSNDRESWIAIITRLASRAGPYSDSVAEHWADSVQAAPCDEVHPRCGNCLKHGVACDFQNPDIVEDLVATASAPSPAPPAPASTTVSAADASTPASSPTIPSLSDLKTPSQGVTSPALSFATPLYTMPSTPTISTKSPTNRLLELRLMHQYTSMTSRTLVVNSPITDDIWQNTVPRLAFSGANYLRKQRPCVTTYGLGIIARVSALRK
ncbi:hypothetical protein BN1723_016910, partial [Verticillium longisporum]